MASATKRANGKTAKTGRASVREEKSKSGKLSIRASRNTRAAIKKSSDEAKKARAPSSHGALKSRVAGVREVKSRLSEYIEHTRQAPVIVLKNGKPAAIMYSCHGMDLEDVMLYSNPKFQRILKKALDYDENQLVDF